MKQQELETAEVGVTAMAVNAARPLQASPEVADTKFAVHQVSLPLKPTLQDHADTEFFFDMD